jgi:hypothetical protein
MKPYPFSLLNHFTVPFAKILPSYEKPCAGRQARGTPHAVPANTPRAYNTVWAL